MLVDSKTQIVQSSSFEIEQRTLLAMRQRLSKGCILTSAENTDCVRCYQHGLSNNHVIGKSLFAHFFLSSDQVKENVLIWF